jgi:hypothetical protein
MFEVEVMDGLGSVNVEEWMGYMLEEKLRESDEDSHQGFGQTTGWAGFLNAAWRRRDLRVDANFVNFMF